MQSGWAVGGQVWVHNTCLRSGTTRAQELTILHQHIRATDQAQTVSIGAICDHTIHDDVTAAGFEAITASLVTDLESTHVETVATSVADGKVSDGDGLAAAQIHTTPPLSSLVERGVAIVNLPHT